MFLSFNVKLSICRANIRRSREQNKFICYAEAQQYFRRSRISQKPRAEQIYLLCRGATVFPAKANIVRSRISQKPKVAYLARKGRVPGLYGGGEKCYGFTANRFTFPQEYNIALADAIHEIYMVQHASAIFIVE